MKIKKQIWFVISSLIFVAFIIVISPKLMQNDTFWSIKVGERIVNEGIFGEDNFSIHSGLYYIAHHFLTDVLIYIVYNFAGFVGLHMLEIALALIFGVILYLLNKEICKNRHIAAVMCFIQMLMMSMFIAVRAQMISFIFFALELLLLEKFKKDNKKSYIIGLSIIPIILANFHMGVVPFYFIILGVYIIASLKIKILFLDCDANVDKQKLKQLIVVFIVGLITIFINPYFVDGVTYPFKTFGNEFINSNIAEFQALSISLDGGYSHIYILCIILILIVAKEKLKLEDFLLLFGTMLMSFVAIRYVSLFVICSSVILRYVNKVKESINLDEVEIKTLKGTSIVVMSLIILVLLSNSMLDDKNEYVSDKVYPISAVEFLKENMSEEDRIFNLYDWGSYLMLNGIQVYIDSRCDLYTKEYNGIEIADDYSKLTNCDKDYKEIIKKYNINMFLIPINKSLNTLLDENPEWEKIYEDDVAAIYKRK